MGKKTHGFFSPWEKWKSLETAQNSGLSNAECQIDTFQDQLWLNIVFEIFNKTPRGFSFEKTPRRKFPVGKNQYLNLTVITF